MLEAIATAIEAEDYRGAAQLLKSLLKGDGCAVADRRNPWVQFYVGRVQEGLGKTTEAEKLYRQLLPQVTNPKLMAQVRQGIARISALKVDAKEGAIATALAAPGGQTLGALILEPLGNLDKKAAAQAFGAVMNIDAYTARLQLPSRGWRFYRTGKMGELQYYIHQLHQAEIPCFALPLTKLSELNVFTVQYVAAGGTAPTVRCLNSEGQKGTLSFQWSEISQRVEGRIPLFESVVTVDAKHRIVRKTQLQDYVAFCDLHLPGRNCILRLSEHHYQFLNGITLTPALAPGERDTVSQGWQYLMAFLEENLPSAFVWSDFASFADTVLDFRETLSRIPAQLDLDRRQSSLWDPAFHLYSGLAYWRQAHGSPQSQLPPSF
ncbi:MAG: tetratricopeptide repeat protein [Spirulina sp. DLM2.Bin59]|nr:MAG: tetratricopeptide repeat protein [Spirulina sp. DLM2.Bin59]